MKTLLNNIINSVHALRELKDEKFPPKVAYRLQKILREVEKEVGEFEHRRHTVITKDYGEEEVKGSGNWKVKEESMPDFVKYMEELLSDEVDIPFDKIIIPDDIKITPSTAFLLEWMINFEEE